MDILSGFGLNIRKFQELSLKNFDYRGESFKKLIIGRLGFYTWAILAVHSDARGTPLGGTRVTTYDSEKDALVDGLGLARGMTFKAAAAELNLGGGKIVIYGNFHDGLIPAYGEFLNKINSNSKEPQIITSVDMGFSGDQIDKLTQYAPNSVVGKSPALGGFGDPSSDTAKGVYLAGRASLEILSLQESKVSVAIQGLGKTGYPLAKMWKKFGAKVYGADRNPATAKRAEEKLGIEIVSPESILFQRVTMICPCAGGRIFNSTSISYLHCRAICGAANEQLAKPASGSVLRNHGIFYAPDFIVNVTGLLAATAEYFRYSKNWVESQIQKIPERLKTIHQISEHEKVAMNIAAEDYAREKIA